MPKLGESKNSSRLENLLTEATSMFLEQGYESLSIDELVRRVGGSKRNVYSQFQNKEALFIKVASNLCEELSVPLRNLQLNHSDPRVALEKFSRELLKVVLDERTLALHRLMIAEAVRFPKLSQTIWKLGHDAACKLLADWIEDQKSAGRLVISSDAASVAAQFISSLTGYLQLRALLKPHSHKTSKQEIESFVEAAVASFLLSHSSKGSTKSDGK
ncbi:MAG: TetR/AcrR family transcriptional regulator [Proteobacteria bacterium]|nr:MAG: TetR/AcrR family transcriptional regulator [Pseudomonadota bacterium]